MFRRLWCRFIYGHDLRLVRNIYGDEINLVNARSLWRCRQCDAWRYLPVLGQTPEGKE